MKRAIIAPCAPLRTACVGAWVRVSVCATDACTHAKSGVVRRVRRIVAVNMSLAIIKFELAAAGPYQNTSPSCNVAGQFSFFFSHGTPPMNIYVYNSNVANDRSERNLSPTRNIHPPYLRPEIEFAELQVHASCACACSLACLCVCVCALTRLQWSLLSSEEAVRMRASMSEYLDNFSLGGRGWARRGRSLDRADRISHALAKWFSV